MKFLVHANAPWVKTGYGVQAGYLGKSLRAAGHEVAFSSTHGLEGDVIQWSGFRVYPRLYDPHGNDIVNGHAEHFFGDTPRDECWIVTIIDVWGMITPRLADYNVLAWTPIDHHPCPPGVLEFFKRTQAVPVAMSRFGESELVAKGLDPVYVPLSVDTNVYKPTATIGEQTGRQRLGLPDDAFVVGMFAMNKGWAKDRKGFNEAFWAWGQFIRSHPDAVLYMHTEMWGLAEGQQLGELAAHAGIGDKNIVWAGGPGQYGQKMGFTPEAMAAAYSACDVLLAPSHGEGFCVPLIEAQACGVPVITTGFSTGPELVGPGWLLEGQPEWDPAQHAMYVCPFIVDVVDKLELAYEGARDEKLKAKCVEFAQTYDTARVYAEHWALFLETLKTGTVENALREPIPEKGGVAVIVPLRRPANLERLSESFERTTPKGAARLVVISEDDYPEAVSYAQKCNVGYAKTTEPWVLLVGDDVVFHDGWLEAARAVSDRFDVIGTNDTTGKVKNPKVASGAHADHFFVRRSYVEEEGACLDGPGVLAPECYRHWFTDMEQIGLAKARGVFTPCLDSVIEHLHPAYDGDEAARWADSTYAEAPQYSEQDEQTYRKRLPLIEMQRVGRTRVAA